MLCTPVIGHTSVSSRKTITAADKTRNTIKETQNKTGLDSLKHSENDDKVNKPRSHNNYRTFREFQPNTSETGSVSEACEILMRNRIILEL